MGMKALSGLFSGLNTAVQTQGPQFLENYMLEQEKAAKKKRGEEYMSEYDKIVAEQNAQDPEIAPPPGQANIAPPGVAPQPGAPASMSQPASMPQPAITPQPTVQQPQGSLSPSTGQATVGAPIAPPPAPAPNMANMVSNQVSTVSRKTGKTRTDLQKDTDKIAESIGQSLMTTEFKPQDVSKQRRALAKTRRLLTKMSIEGATPTQMAHISELRKSLVDDIAKKTTDPSAKARIEMSQALMIKNRDLDSKMEIAKLKERGLSKRDRKARANDKQKYAFQQVKLAINNSKKDAKDAKTEISKQQKSEDDFIKKNGIDKYYEAYPDRVEFVDNTWPYENQYKLKPDRFKDLYDKQVAAETHEGELNQILPKTVYADDESLREIVESMTNLPYNLSPEQKAEKAAKSLPGYSKFDNSAGVTWNQKKIKR